MWLSARTAITRRTKGTGPLLRRLLRVPYEELGGDYFHRRQQERAERDKARLVRLLERLGHRMTLEPLAEAA